MEALINKHVDSAMKSILQTPAKRASKKHQELDWDHNVTQIDRNCANLEDHASQISHDFDLYPAEDIQLPDTIVHALAKELPTTNVKTKTKHHSSFYHCRAMFSIPKPPLDPDFEVGCNDDVLSETAHQSLNTVESAKKRSVTDWLAQERKKTVSKLAMLCESTTPLKRQALPSSVTWNGKGGADFEKYLDKVTGHVG